MPLKRPNSPTQRASSSSSEPQTPSEIQPPPSKKTRLSAPAPTTGASASAALKGLNVHILDAKLASGAIAEMRALLARCGANASHTARAADVVVTAVTMRRRLERHIDWETAKTKAVVTPEWLRRSARDGKPAPCEEYAAVQGLRRPTPSASREPNSGDRTPTRSAARSPAALSPPRVPPPAHLLPPAPPPACDAASLDPGARFACLRASPLVCANQALCAQLDVMRRAREAEGAERSALSYRRAVSVIKAYPRKISSAREVQKLPYIGEKLLTMYIIYPTFAATKVEQYLTTGQIVEVQSTLASPRFHALETLSTVYGIGATTARNLYALGLRTVEDLHKYYEVRLPSGDAGDSAAAADEPGQALLRGAVIDPEEDGEEPWIKIALSLREDLGKKIPRSEVEEIHRVIVSELEAVQPGCVSTIVGGYRRGKPESNDVDIVFTHPDGEKAKGLCKRAMARLHQKGLVTHVMHLSSFHAHNALRTTHWDSLEKALTVFVLPSADAGGPRRLRRRVDFIFAQPEAYWTAIVGWTGSTMFERDLRYWAKGRGLKFDSSGITRRRDSRLIYPRSEKEVFDTLGLPWIDPTMRNADL